MSTQKTLKINPALFTLNGRKKEKKTNTNRVRPVIGDADSKNTNKVKKELLRKVKEFQKNKEQEQIKEDKKDLTQGQNLFEKNEFENSDFEREFNKSLNFLQDLAKKNKEKKNKVKNTTMKNIPNIEINMDLPDELQRANLGSTEPLYSCLKNGNKPTYKTQKNTDSYSNDSGRRIKIVLENNVFDDDPKPPIKEKTEFQEIIDNKIDTINSVDIDKDLGKDETINLSKDLPKTLSENLSKSLDLVNETEININTDNDINENKDLHTNERLKMQNIPKINKITRTKKYKIGKKKGANHIGILIKNRETLKNIKNEVTKLKTKSIQEIKNYLREKNLIKVGSQSPNDVLRKLYENAILSGEITNTNDNNMLFNYLND